MVLPSSISNENPSAAWWAYTYQHHSTISGYEIYVRTAINDGSISSYTQIKVSTDPLASDYNQWSDHIYEGGDAPSSVVDDGTVVTLFHSSGYILFQFTKPTVASWISTLPPPNTNDFVSPSLTYNFATNRLSWILPASYSSTSDPLITAHRTDYLLDNDTLWLPATPGYTTYIFHTQGTPSIGNSTNDISPGQWSIRRKISAPSGMTSILASITFTQIEVDAYNAAVAAQAAADAASAAGSNAPPNTPRGRRGNHNFW